VKQVNRAIRLDLARAAAALHLDLGVRLAGGLAADDRALAPTLTEAVARLEAIEEIAESDSDDGVVIMLIADLAELLPLSEQAEAFAQAAQRFLVAAQNILTDPEGKNT
jgi:hypothetical protein